MIPAEDETNPPRTNTSDLETFWQDLTDRQIEMTAPKVAEYGSHDLVEIGRELRAMSGHDTDDDRLNYEAGVFFYVRGKIARWSNAVRRGEPVSQDTLDDIIIYAVLALHDRASGE